MQASLCGDTSPHGGETEADPSMHPTALAAKARPLRAVAAGVADADAQAAAVRGDDEVAGDAPTLDPAHGARLWAATDRVLVDLGVGRFLVRACRDTYAGTK